MKNQIGLMRPYRSAYLRLIGYISVNKLKVGVVINQPPKIQICATPAEVVKTNDREATATKKMYRIGAYKPRCPCNDYPLWHVKAVPENCRCRLLAL